MKLNLLTLVLWLSFPVITYAQEVDLKTKDQVLQKFADTLLTAIQEENTSKIMGLYGQKMTYEDWVDTFKLYKEKNSRKMSDQDISYVARKTFKNHCYHEIEKSLWQKLYPKKAKDSKAWDQWKTRRETRKTDLIKHIKEVFADIKSHKIDLDRLTIVHIEFFRKKDKSFYDLHRESDVYFLFTDQKKSFYLKVEDLIKTTREPVINYKIEFTLKKPTPLHGKSKPSTHTASNAQTVAKECHISLNYKYGHHMEIKNNLGVSMKDPKDAKNIICLMNMKKFMQISKERKVKFTYQEKDQTIVYKSQKYQVVSENESSKVNPKTNSSIPTVYILQQNQEKYIKVDDLYQDEYTYFIYRGTFSIRTHNGKHVSKSLRITKNIHSCESKVKGECSSCQLKVLSNKFPKRQKKGVTYKGVKVNVSKLKDTPVTHHCFIKKSEALKLLAKLSYGAEIIDPNSQGKTKGSRKIKVNHKHLTLQFLDREREVKPHGEYNTLHPYLIRALKQDKKEYINIWDICKKFTYLECSQSTKKDQYTYTIQDQNQSLIKKCTRSHKDSCLKVADLFNHNKAYIKDLSKLKKTLQKACKRNTNEACFELGKLYHRGVNLKKDYKRAEKYYNQSCTRSYLPACEQLYWIASYYNEGKKVKKDHQKAKGLLESSCKNGYMASCNDLGVQYLVGKNGSQKDTKLTLIYFKQACDQKFVVSCRNLALIHTNGNVKKDLSYAFKIYNKACQLKDGKSCYKLASMYRKGKGTKVNYDQMRMAYEQACEYDYMSACNSLAWHLYSGKLIPQDYDESLKLHKKSCQGKVWEACRELATSFYKKGIAVKKDDQKAYNLYQKACRHNHAHSCNQLAWSLFHGEGVQKDLGQSANFFEKSCTKGYLKGCTQVSKMYTKGEGVSIDLVKAKEFAKRAKKKKNKK
jgi:uncharacterized protein